MKKESTLSQVEILDVSKRARSKIHMVNGSRTLAFLAIFILFASLISIIENNPGAMVVSFLFAALVSATSIGIRRGNRVAALASGFLLLFILVRSFGFLSPVGPRELPLLCLFAYFIIQAIRGVFIFHRSIATSGRSSRLYLKRNRAIIKWPNLLAKKNVFTILSLMFLALTSFILGLGILLRRLYGQELPILNVLSDQRRIFQYLSDIIAFGLIGLGYWLYRRAKRHSTLGVAELRKRDIRPPILLLRSFRDDMIEIEKKHIVFLSFRFFSSLTFEELITYSLRKFGPIIAIGQPKEPLPPIGAARQYLTNESWQDKIAELTAESKFIVMILGKTAGVRWELWRILEHNLLPSFVLLFPPVTDLGERWSRIYEDLGLSFPLNFSVEKTLMMTFSGNGQISCITGKQRTWSYYEEALMLATEKFFKY